jgi:epoxide hydrolase-like predicted phosphatase
MINSDKSKTSLAIFDLGNVVFNVDWQPMFDSWSESSGVETKFLQERFKFDAHFEAFERNKISGHEFWKAMCETLVMDIAYEEFVTGWNAIYQEVVPETQNAIEQLQGNIKVVAFTNTNLIHSTIWPRKYSKVLKNFDHVFSSSEMGVRKPEVEAFQMVLDQCQTTVSEAIFFDDLPLNIEAAHNMGLRAILVDSPDSVSLELKRLGLLNES